MALSRKIMDCLLALSRNLKANFNGDHYFKEIFKNYHFYLRWLSNCVDGPGDGFFRDVIKVNAHTVSSSIDVEGVLRLVKGYRYGDHRYCVVNGFYHAGQASVGDENFNTRMSWKRIQTNVTLKSTVDQHGTVSKTLDEKKADHQLSPPTKFSIRSVNNAFLNRFFDLWRYL
uniref:Uncharacterized protein n=1 Tax=Clastoptera arizonana TaxID=38151 RepID=A0A1B6C1V8_9HEMI